MGIAGKVLMGMAVGTMMAIDMSLRANNNHYHHNHREVIVVNDNHRVGQNNHGTHH